MKPLHAFGSIRISGGLLPGPSAVVRIADEAGLLAPIKDAENAIETLDCTFADTDGAPTTADAKRILAFARAANKNPKVQHIVAQCQAGVGRSVAVCAALARIAGVHWEQMGTYNRTLYRLILEEAGLAPDPEPLVTIAVRVKYGPECLMGFMLSLQKQRYSNWHAVAYTDGPRPDIRQLAALFDGNHLTLIETDEQLGRWGHPYRQLAIDHCKGEWIGTNNDDNYLTPGYIEQMVRAAERSGAKLVTCCGAHRYSGWGICPAGSDLACWIAHRDIVQQVRWEGTDFLADQTYLQKLIQVAGGRVAEVPRVLVVKN